MPQPLILTANERLQRHLAQNDPSPQHVTAATHIYSLERWLEDTWLQLQDMAYPGSELQLINAQDEFFLWQRFIVDSSFQQLLIDSGVDLSELINHRQLVDQLMQAHTLIEQWLLNHAAIAQQASPETRFLITCLETYNLFVAQKNCIRKDQAIKVIGDAINDGILEKPSTLSLHGFTEVSPLWHNTLNTLCPTSEPLSALTTQAPAAISQHNLHQFSRLNIEIEAAALWCQEKLEQLKDGEHIGIIVPNLSSIHREVADGFNRIFDPEHILNTDSELANVPYDISASSMLAEEPIIQIIFDLLELKSSTIELHQLQKLNLSAFWGEGVGEVRLRTSQTLKQHLSFEVTIAHYFDLLSQANTVSESANKTDEAEEKNNTVNDSRRLSQFLQLVRQNRKPASIPQWNTLLCDLLNTLGWPGSRVLNSREYQAVQALFNVFDTLERQNVLFSSTHETKSHQTKNKRAQHFNSISEKLTLNEYIRLVRSIIENTSFHVQMPARPIQILGIMEGAGMSFAHCRLIGMTAENFPTPPQPNALIPYSIQKDAHTPRSTPERELEYATQLLNTYRQQNPNLCFSYHSHDNSEQILEPSPLIRDITFPEITNNHITLTNAIAQLVETKITTQTTLETIDATFAPAYKNGSTIDGGSYHLQLHVANPFYAFATYRLGITQEQEPAIGFPAFIKGSVIHQLLAIFWNDFKHSEAILELTDTELNTYFSHQFDSVIQPHIRRHQLNISGDYLNAYSQQICQILVATVAVDKGRPPFSVTATEQAATITLNGFHYNLRLDRIDIAQGQQLVIDYKTGASTIRGMQENILVDPQLPLYTLANNKNPFAAVSYFELSAQKCRYVGIGDLNSAITGILPPEKLNRYELPATWEETCRWWRERLETYTQQLTDGYAANLDRNPSITNYYSHLAPAARSTDTATTTESSHAQ